MEIPDKEDYGTEEYTFPKNRIENAVRAETNDNQFVDGDVYAGIDKLLGLILEDIVESIADNDHARIRRKHLRPLIEKYTRPEEYEEIMDRVSKHLEAQAADLVNLSDDIHDVRKD